jgi:hypothetical protein
MQSIEKPTRPIRPPRRPIRRDRFFSNPAAGSPEAELADDLALLVRLGLIVAVPDHMGETRYAPAQAD